MKNDRPAADDLERLAARVEEAARAADAARVSDEELDRWADRKKTGPAVARAERALEDAAADYHAARARVVAAREPVGSDGLPEPRAVDPHGRAWKSFEEIRREERSL